MSFKAKNIEFDNTQPAFLQRLRGQIAGGDTSRHDQPIPRNKRMKKGDDEDDAPTYVLEDTNQSLSKEEYDAFVAGEDLNEKKDVEEKREEQSKPAEDAQSKERIAEVGRSSKKRKAVKVIGGGDEEKEGEVPEKTAKSKDAKVIKKPKKKAKPVKLSFNDQEEG